MATNLTGQVRNIAEVTTAVANGDCEEDSRWSVKGEILERKNTVNRWWTSSTRSPGVTRVAREVGTEGKLGGQAMCTTWRAPGKDLTDNVNAMRPT